jgi:hypothetical protein
MNPVRIREKVSRIIELADSIADEYQHELNLHASAGVPASGVGGVCRLVRIIESAERTARDWHALLDHPDGLGADALHGLVPRPHGSGAGAGGASSMASGDG